MYTTLGESKDARKESFLKAREVQRRIDEEQRKKIRGKNKYKIFGGVAGGSFGFLAAAVAVKLDLTKVETFESIPFMIIQLCLILVGSISAQAYAKSKRESSDSL